MNCPVCDSATTDLPDQLSQCLQCNHLFQNPLEVRMVYDQQYASRYDGYETTPAMSALRVGVLKAFVTEGKLLDVGYGNGSFAKLACKAGFDAYGSDLHGHDYGVRDVPLVSNEQWDVVTFFDSLEHFTTLDVIRDLNRRCRLILISFPRRPSSFPSDRNWKHYKPLEHLHYFSISSLQALFTGKELLMATDAEDAIRGKHADGSGNIWTAVFKSN